MFKRNFKKNLKKIPHAKQWQTPKRKNNLLNGLWIPNLNDQQHKIFENPQNFKCSRKLKYILI